MRQTSLPDYVTDPISRDPSSARGFSTPEDPKERQRKNRPQPRVTRMSTATFNVDSNSRNILGYNSNRTYLMIQNNGTADVFISWGGRADASGVNSAKMPAGSVWTFDYICPSNEFTAVSTVGSILSVTEGQNA